MKAGKRIFRRIAWWSALSLLILLAVAWAFSHTWGLLAFYQTGGPLTYGSIQGTKVQQIPLFPIQRICLADGVIVILTDSDIVQQSDISVLSSYSRDSVIKWYVTDNAPQSGWPLKFGGTDGVYFVPLWIPFVAIAVPFLLVSVAARKNRSKLPAAIQYKWIPKKRSVLTSSLWSIVATSVICSFIIPLIHDKVFTPINNQHWSDTLNIPIDILLMADLILPFIVGPVLALNFLWLFRWKRIPISENGSPLCLTCRFNLKGNTSGICPECGTPVQSKPVAPTGT